MSTQHTLNNLLQGPVFSIADLDTIAENLRQVAQEDLQRTMWKNPGMGYYDVSVLEAALNQQDCTLAWFDARLGGFRSGRVNIGLGSFDYLMVPMSTWIRGYQGHQRSRDMKM
ncbi:hypothetical protein BGZ83_000165 [Gryganskiella cystojenkinii]|nr:hypothetical protein BGZ83_000165 [Gryganskiella cystojenkinii]